MIPSKWRIRKAGRMWVLYSPGGTVRGSFYIWNNAVRAAHTFAQDKVITHGR